MTTTWDRISETAFVSEDWRWVIEQCGGEWRVSDRGVMRRAFPSLEMAQAWVGGNVIR